MDREGVRVPRQKHAHKHADHRAERAGTGQASGSTACMERHSAKKTGSVRIAGAPKQTLIGARVGVITPIPLPKLSSASCSRKAQFP